jgi:hypothetical protein
MGRGLLCKLRAQITIDSDGTTALKLRGPKAMTLILMVKQEEKWWLYVLEGRPLEIPKPPFKIPDIWMARSHPCQPKAVLHSSQGLSQNPKTL